MKPGLKMKLPLGVPPIPLLLRDNEDNKKEEKKEASKSPEKKDEVKNVVNVVDEEKRAKSVRDKEFLQELGEVANQDRQSE